MEFIKKILYSECSYLKSVPILKMFLFAEFLEISRFKISDKNFLKFTEFLSKNQEIPSNFGK